MKTIAGVCTTFSRRSRFIAFAALLLVGGWLMQAAQAAAPQPILFGSNAAYPPITFQDNGHPKGVVVDIVHAIEQRIGRPVDIRLMAWKEAQKQVQEGKLDFIGPMAITEERKALYDFSAPVLDLSVHLFVRKGRLGIDSLADIQWMRVGVAAGGLAHQVAKKAPGIHLTTLSDDQVQNFRLLANGELDALICDSWNCGYLLAEQQIAEVEMVGEPLLLLPSHLAVKKGNSGLLAEVDAALRALEANGELARIKAKWRPKEIVVATREAVQQQRYLAVIGFLLLTLTAGALWVFSMRREVGHRRAAEAAALKSKARFRILVETSPLAMVVASPPPESRFLLINRQFTELFGYTMADVPDMATWWLLAYPDPAYRQEVQAQWAVIIDAMVAAGSPPYPARHQAHHLQGWHDALYRCPHGRRGR